MNKWAGRGIAAFRFLTIVPLPGSRGTAEEELAHATPFFPLVGLVIGLLSASAAWLLSLVLPPLPGAVVLVALLATFSGALHLDGLADSADGFFSSRPGSGFSKSCAIAGSGPWEWWPCSWWCC